MRPKKIQFKCQNCDKQYERIKDFKLHCRSFSHKQEVSKLFQTAMHHGPVYVPIIVVLDYLRNPIQSDPLIGLDMVTLFITPEKFGAFYLCHVCEKQLSSADIMVHLCSDEHYLKYLAYSNPDLLRFAWLNDSFSYLKTSAMQVESKCSSISLRIFELPKMLLKRGKKLTYDQVISMFSKIDKVMDRVRAGTLQRKTIQQYINDPGRANPLIGLKFLLEYSCPENKEYCRYLCLLCKKKLPAIDCIPHCISFDHVYGYLETSNPDALAYPKSSYTHYSYSFHKNFFTLGNKAQRDCPPRTIQTVQLDVETFKNVDSLKYSNALNKLQQIRREGKSELSTTVKLGEQRCCGPLANASPVSMPATDVSGKRVEITQKDSKSQNRVDQACRILCVECDQIFACMSAYKQHIAEKEHMQKFRELFGTGAHKGLVSEIKLYHYIWSCHKKMSPPSLIGLPLLTVFVQRQSQNFNPPIYVCHACELNIPVSSVSAHLGSPKHYFNVFAYAKPDLVFGTSWNSKQITEFAQEEEKKKEMDKMVLRVCELPSMHFSEFRSLAYEKLMTRFRGPMARKCVQVEKRVTLQSFSKSCDRKAPLLGMQFMLKYRNTGPYYKGGYLCLLCEEKLPERHAIVHVLSFPHVFAYLTLAHPGSLSKEDGENVSLVMDLAQQAEQIGPNVAIQEVELRYGVFHEVECSSFKAAMDLIHSVFRDKGLGELKPSVVPGPRLVSSFKRDGQESSQCKKQDADPTSLDTKQVTFDTMLTEAPTHRTDDDMDIDLDLEHTEILETTQSAFPHIQPASPSVPTTLGNFNPTTLPSYTQQSEPLEDCPEPLNQAVLPHSNSTEVIPVIEHPQIQASSLTEKQSVELPQKTTNLKHSLPEPNSLELKTDVQEVPQTSPVCSKLWSYLKTPNRDPVIGLKSVIECHTDGQPPFYVCVTCAEKCDENFIINHLTCREHQRKYLESIDYAPLMYKKKVKTKWLHTQAILVEKKQGYGDAEVLELDAKDYREIFSAPIISALGKIRDFLLKLTSEISVRSPVAACSDNVKNDETLKTLKEEKDSAHDHRRGTVKQGTDDPAQSSPHLWSYLTNPTRSEPVIGLSMVTEYRSSTGQNSFLCSCCEVILGTSNYMDHLISQKHRFNYIKFKHPELVALWKDDIDLTRKITELKVKAQILQDMEGWGCLKVVDKETPKNKQLPTEESGTSSMAQEPEPSQTTSNSQELEPARKSAKAQEPKPFKTSSNSQELEPARKSAKAQEPKPFQTSSNSQELEPARKSAKAQEPEPFQTSSNSQELEPARKSAKAQEPEPFQTPSNFQELEPARKSPKAQEPEPFQTSSNSQELEPARKSAKAQEPEPFQTSSNFQELEPTRKSAKAQEPEAFQTSSNFQELEPARKSAKAQEPEPFQMSSNSQELEPARKSAKAQEPKPFQTSSNFKELEPARKSAKAQEPKPFQMSSNFKELEPARKSAKAHEPEPFQTSSNSQELEPARKSAKAQEPEPFQTSSNFKELEPTRKSAKAQEPEPFQTSSNYQIPEPSRTSTNAQEPEPYRTSSNSQEPEPCQKPSKTQEPEPFQTSSNLQVPEPFQTSSNLQVPEPYHTSSNSQEHEPPQTPSKTPQPEPSQTSAATVSTEQQDQSNKGLNLTNQQSKKKKNKLGDMVGLNFVTCVSHGKNKLLFCELCSVRCDVDHMSRKTHKKTCVEYKYPGWTASGVNVEKELNKMVLRLAKVERSTGLGMKKLNVSAKVFDTLQFAPVSQALSQLTDLKRELVAGMDLPDRLQPSSNNALVQDKIPESETTAQDSFLTPPPDPCSFSSFPPSSLPNSSPVSTSSAPNTPTTALVSSANPVPPTRPYSPVSPPPPFLYSTVSPAFPFPCSTLNTPPLSSQSSTRAHCLSAPSILYEPVSPPPVFSHRQSPHIALLNPASPPDAVRPGHCMSEEPASVCSWSMLTEDSKNNIALSYSFPSLPTVVGQSFASGFLRAKGLQDTVIGLSNILECRKMKQPTFYLCLNCSENVSRLDMCTHITSERHQYFTIITQYPEILQHREWQTISTGTIPDLAANIASQEKGSDAKVIKLDQLDQEQYKSLCSADFHDVIQILQKIYGPEQSKDPLPLELTGQNQRNREISTPRSVPDSVENEQQRDRHEGYQSRDLTPQQDLPSSQVPRRDFDSMQDQFGRSTVITTLQGQSTLKALPERRAQEKHCKYESITQTCLTAESDPTSTGLQYRKPHARRTPENPCMAEQSGSSNQNALQIPVKVMHGLQKRQSEQFLPCPITIKQEKLDDDDVVVMMTPLKAPSPKEATGSTSKRKLDLKEYVSSKRAVPHAIVGLSSVIECRSEGQFPLYLCVSCSSKLNHDLIIDHLLKCGHRYSYLRARYPSFFEDWSESDSRSERSMRLMWLSHNAESMHEDEPGELQEMKLKCDDLKAIKGMSYDKAIAHLQNIRKEQKLCALQTCIVPKITTALIKQERITTEVTMQRSPRLGDLPGMSSPEPRRAVKRGAQEPDSSQESLSRKKSSEDSSSHVKQPVYTENSIPELESPVKWRKSSVNSSDNVSEQNELSALTTVNSEQSPIPCCISVTVSETSPCPSQNVEPNNQPYKSTISVDETVSKINVLSSHMLTAKQKDACAKGNTISVLPYMEGKEIARLAETRPLVKKRSNENHWNYENRQFCSGMATTDTNIMADTSNKTVANNGQNMPYSVQIPKKEPNSYHHWKSSVNCLDASAYAGIDKTTEPSTSVNNYGTSTLYPLLAHNANWNLSVAPEYGIDGVTSELAPKYTIPHQYPMFEHAFPQTTGIPNAVAPNCAVAVGERAPYVEAAATDVSVNGSYLTNTNYTSQTDYQSHQVYQANQAFQNTEAYPTYYPLYTSVSQSHPQNQTSTVGESVTPTASTHGQDGGLQPLMRWSQFFSSFSEYRH